MFGKGIQKQLDKKDMTAYRLAQKSGVSRATVSRIINDIQRWPSLSSLEAICKVLGCKIKDLL